MLNLWPTAVPNWLPCAAPPPVVDPTPYRRMAAQAAHEAVLIFAAATVAGAAGALVAPTRDYALQSVRVTRGLVAGGVGMAALRRLPAHDPWVDPAHAALVGLATGVVLTSWIVKYLPEPPTGLLGWACLTGVVAGAGAAACAWSALAPYARP